MLIRELLIWWHLAMFTKAWATEQVVWDVLSEHGLHAEDDAQALQDAPELAPLRTKWQDHAWRTEMAPVVAEPGILTRLDAAYPPRLAEITQPPLVLFYAGDLTVLNQLTLAIVGSRNAGRYSRDGLARLADTLPEMTILSGLAIGADTFAHEFALDQGWPTVAVVANGLDRVYPRRNVGLQARIQKSGGLLLSEYPPGVGPEPYRFVARNRIIAGLAHGILVTEAAAHSGSLITANFGLQHNREVFALPNLLTEPLGVGTNQLIQAGAKLVETGADIAAELQFYP